MTEHQRNTAPPCSTRQRGQHYELLAESYLVAQGMRPLQHNFRARCGEIDLIMQEASVLVFVEVRYRRGPQYGSALASVTQRKQHRLMRTAKLFLKARGLYDKVDCRFDVIGIQEDEHQEPVITWVPNAFP